MQVIPKNNKLPIGNLVQYDHVVSLYLTLIDKGVNPQVALEMTNQKIAEKGWDGWSTGDNKKYNTVEEFADHLIDWHSRMYPDSLKATSFDEYYEGINGTRELHDKNRKSGGKDNSGRYYYNTERGYDGYRNDLLKTRPYILKRINYYRQLQGLSPLSYMPKQLDIYYASNGVKLIPRSKVYMKLL